MSGILEKPGKTLYDGNDVQWKILLMIWILTINTIINLPITQTVIYILSF